MGLVQIENIKDVCCKLSGIEAALMSSKFESAIWSRDTGYLGMHGGVDVPYGCTVTKTKFSRIDGLPYFLTYGTPLARLRRAELCYY